MSHPEPCDEASYELGREVGFQCGAAVVFGLVGMGFAIRDHEWYCAGCDTIITTDPWECSMGCGGRRP